ncbi:undecaprenyldiphospho-muramoylpentapeptide beta-N-acetylglucosaminyltransferase [Candidatus Sumerlaeota bacterium]
MSSQPNVIAIAAGGTGGHIYPALATAEAISAADPSTQVRFFCGQRKVELAIYEAAGIEPIVLPMGSFGSGITGKARTAWQLWRARRESGRVLRELNPRCLLAMGGYVAFGPVWAARRLNVPIVLHEQNVVLGRAHQLAGKWAARVACSFPETVKGMRGTPAVLTGNPVRAAFLEAERQAARQHFEIDERAQCIVITGGSQGARALNQMVADGLGLLGQWAAEQSRPLALIWSCGMEHLKQAQEAVFAAQGPNLSVVLSPFIDRMDLACAAADLAVGRAGAGTISEQTARGLPAVLVPLPGSIHDHQQLNAESISRRGAAVILNEAEPAGNGLGRLLIDLLSDQQRLDEMAAASKRCGRPNAAERLAQLVASLGADEK